MGTSLNKSCAELRDEVRKLRRARTSQHPTEAAKDAQGAGLRLIHWLKSRGVKSGLVGAFISLPQEELPISSVLQELLAQSYSLAFPECRDMTAGAGRLIWHQVSREEFENLGQWPKDRHGIPFPEGNEIDPSKFAALLVPGVVYGQGGERIGMGMGYYDRMLASLPPQVHRLALAYDFQVHPQLPQHPWDQRIHRIFTEKGEYGP